MSLNTHELGVTQYLVTYTFPSNGTSRIYLWNRDIEVHISNHLTLLLPTHGISLKARQRLPNNKQRFCIYNRQIDPTLMGDSSPDFDIDFLAWRILLDVVQVII